MASQLKVFVDWSSVPIWCCGKFLIGEEIFKHAEEKHKKPDNAVNDKSPRIKSKEAQANVNIDEEDKNNNSIPIVNNEGSETLLERKKSDDKKYYCDKCVYTAKRKSSLTRHIENRHLGIRHECEVCQYSCTSKNGLILHRTRKHRKNKIEHEHDAFTTTPNSSQKENMDVSEIKPEIVTPTHLSNIGEIKWEIETPPPPEVQNDVAEIKQEIDISDNHIGDIPNGEVPVLIEVKEEVGDKNLQVPGFRILPQFEHPPLEDRKSFKAANREVDPVGVEEQQNILKFHAKLEKQEKLRKKRDARWWKRLAEIHKLQEVKDRDSGRVVKMEGDDIEVLWPNEDLIRDIVIVDDVRDGDTVQNTEGVVYDMEVLNADAFMDNEDVVMDDKEVAAVNMGQNSLSSESSTSK